MMRNASVAGRSGESDFHSAEAFLCVEISGKYFYFDHRVNYFHLESINLVCTTKHFHLPSCFIDFSLESPIISLACKTRQLPSKTYDLQSYQFVIERW